MKKSGTKHYSSEEWVDFAMDTTAPAQKTEMQRHLATGCAPCRELLVFWTRVGEIAARERALAPPDSAVRHVRMTFASMGKSQRAERMPLFPRLAFDSLWQPAMAGIRSSAFGVRKLLYQTRDIAVEMHIEAESKAERVNLAGQITIGSLQGQKIPSFPVTVSGPQGKIAATTTNSFGEFQVSYVPEGELQLVFEILNGDTLVVPLENSMERVLHRK